MNLRYNREHLLSLYRLGHITGILTEVVSIRRRSGKLFVRLYGNHAMYNDKLVSICGPWVNYRRYLDVSIADDGSIARLLPHFQEAAKQIDGKLRSQMPCISTTLVKPPMS